MKYLKAYKFPLTLTILLVLYFSTVFSVRLIKSDEQPKTETKKTVLPAATQNTPDSVPSEEAVGTNQVQIDNSAKSGSVSEGTSGTCTVTRNGVVTIVPANQININETGPGDKNVKVECNNSTSQTNGSNSNNTSIKSKIDVNVNTSD